MCRRAGCAFCTGCNVPQLLHLGIVQVFAFEVAEVRLGLRRGHLRRQVQRAKVDDQCSAQRRARAVCARHMIMVQHTSMACVAV